MPEWDGPREAGGSGTRARPDGGRGFTVAFQPIVSVPDRRIVAHEGLLRGLAGTPADGVLGRVPAAERAGFEADAGAAIIARFAELDRASRDGRADLHLNLSPAALIGGPGLLAGLAAAAERAALPPARVVIELTDAERLGDAALLCRLVHAVRGIGFRVALDDFGSGYGALALLGAARPDAVKLGLTLIRGIHHNGVRRALVSSILAETDRLGVGAVAVGVETEGEYHCLVGLGAPLLQGFLVAPPAREELVPAAELALPIRRPVPAWLGAAAWSEAYAPPR